MEKKGISLIRWKTKGWSIMYLSLYLFIFCPRNNCFSLNNVSFNPSFLRFSLPWAPETLLFPDCSISWLTPSLALYPSTLFLKCHISNLTVPLVRIAGSFICWPLTSWAQWHGNTEAQCNCDPVDKPATLLWLGCNLRVGWMACGWQTFDYLDLTVKVEMKIYFLLFGL